MRNVINTALGRYQSHKEAVIISCFFNPKNSEYRRKVFDKWYQSIKHLNHRIIELVIGPGQSQLSKYNDPNITIVYTEGLLWHKETLLNKIIKDLPPEFKYVFWVDADVLFTNKNWLTDGVKQLQVNNIIQPFEFCIHLEQDEIKPNFDVNLAKTVVDKPRIGTKIWRSFCATYNQSRNDHISLNYDIHGHVGFAWASHREILECVPLYDRALIGGADHVIAHASAGQIPHPCVTKAFTDNLDYINEWSEAFYYLVQGKIGYVKGDLYHLWHGDINKRQYLKRIQDFSPVMSKITKRDENGFFLAPQTDYVDKYFEAREVVK